MLIPLLLGLLHASVDAATVSATMRAAQVGPLPLGGAFALIIGYDLLAFASQVPFGWLTDRFGRPVWAMSTGVALTLLAVFLPGLGAVATAAAAGLGNALFHLGAGATVLGLGLDRAAPVGLFVGPGALGLGFGMAYGPTSGPLWPMAMAVILLFVTVQGAQKSLTNRPTPVVSAGSVPIPQVPLVMGLLLFSIVVRSVVGSFAAEGYDRTALLLFGIPVAACLGKGLGGFLADRFGWIETSVLALLLSLPLIALAPPARFLLFGLFLFQMTMPVTLTAAARLLPHRLATAFGWTCLALVVGILPKTIAPLSFLGQRALLAVWILFGAGTLYLALRRLGLKDTIFRAMPLGAKEKVVS